MSHFAKIRSSDNIVVQVIVAEQAFSLFKRMILGLGDHLGFYENTQVDGDFYWIQTSYNTHGGVHSEGGTPLRKNYAGIGSTYDAERDAFYAPQPYPSWTLNDTSCIWEAPTAHPADGERYVWNESTTSWGAVDD